MGWPKSQSQALLDLSLELRRISGRCEMFPNIISSHLISSHQMDVAFSHSHSQFLSIINIWTVFNLNFSFFCTCGYQFVVALIVVAFGNQQRQLRPGAKFSLYENVSVNVNINGEVTDADADCLSVGLSDKLYSVRYVYI